MEEMKEKIFTRGNGQKVTYSEMITVIAKYIAAKPDATYEISVGTDSQNHKQTHMVEVITVHRVGDGGIFFYVESYIRRINVLKQKIYEETRRSLENAMGFVDALAYELIDYDIDLQEMFEQKRVTFGVHADIGHAGQTKELINEITKWIESLKIDVVIKPDSYAASGVANKLSK